MPYPSNPAIAAVVRFQELVDLYMSQGMNNSAAQDKAYVTMREERKQQAEKVEQDREAESEIDDEECDELRFARLNADVL